jgi:hypothetical protein
VCRPGLFNWQFKFQELDDDSGFAYIAKEKIGFAVGLGRRDPASVAELIFFPQIMFPPNRRPIQAQLSTRGNVSFCFLHRTRLVVVISSGPLAPR